MDIINTVHPIVSEFNPNLESFELAELPENFFFGQSLIFSFCQFPGKDPPIKIMIHGDQHIGERNVEKGFIANDNPAFSLKSVEIKPPEGGTSPYDKASLVAPFAAFQNGIKRLFGSLWMAEESGI